jgi:hypothetical protein
MSLPSIPLMTSMVRSTPTTGPRSPDVIENIISKPASAMTLSSWIASSGESTVTGWGGVRSDIPSGSITASIRGSERGSVASVRSGSPSRPGKCGAVIGPSIPQCGPHAARGDSTALHECRRTWAEPESATPGT